MADVCIDIKLAATDPRFQAFMKMFPGRDAFTLMTYLENYRSGLEKGEEWYPDDEFKASFTQYLRYQDRAVKLNAAKRQKKGTNAAANYFAALQAFNHSQLRDAADYVADQFEKYLDAAEEDYPGYSREEIIDACGGFEAIISDVLEGIKEEDVADILGEMLDGNESEAELSEKTNIAYRIKMEHEAILEYKDHIAARAAAKIGELEGIKFSYNGMLVDWKTSREQNADDDTEDQKREEGESKGARYVDFRYKKLADTISPMVKRFLSSIPMLDVNGKPYVTIFGTQRKMDYHQVALSLMREVQGATPATFMKRIKNGAKHYPWMKQLHDALEKDKNMRAILFTDCTRVFNIYTNVVAEKNGYDAKNASSSSKQYSIIRHMFNNMDGNVLTVNSIYDGDGQIRAGFKFKEAKDALIGIANELARVEMRDEFEAVDPYDKDNAYATLVGKEAMDAYLKANPDVIDTITEYARAVGLDIFRDDVLAVAYSEMPSVSRDFSDRHNRLEVLARSLAGIYSIAGNGKLQMAEDMSTMVTKEANGINFSLYSALQDEVEPRVRTVKGGTLSAISNTNLTHQVTDVLRNLEGLSEKEYREKLDTEFFQYEGYTVGGQRFGWLKQLYDKPSVAKKLSFHQQLTFNGVEYAKLSDAQKMLSSYTEWKKDRNTYEFNIKADYSTAYDFLTVPFQPIEVGKKTLPEDADYYGSTIMPLHYIDEDGVERFDTDSPIVKAFADEVKADLERMYAIEARKNDTGRHVLDTYEKEGMKFIFPEFDTNGFREKYESLPDSEAYDFLMRSVADQLEKIVQGDVQKFMSSEVVGNPYIKDMFVKEEIKTPEGRTIRRTRMSNSAMADFREFSLNQFYARLQMTKIYAGGRSHFPSNTEYEKRAMFEHAPHTSLYIEGDQKMLYIEDNVTASAYASELKEMAEALFSAGKITEYQYNAFIDSFNSIKDTDGIAIRTMQSHRKIMKAQGKWTRKHGAAYKRIMDGNPTQADIDLFLFGGHKLVGAGFEHVPAAAGDGQKPIRNPFLHKDSEMILLAPELMKHCLNARSAVMEGIYGAVEKLRKSKVVDLDCIVFKSDVKIGFHSSLDPLRVIEETDDNGKVISRRREFDTADKIRDYIVSEVTKDPNRFIHSIAWKYYGQAATIPEDVADKKIAMPSQAVKAAFSNVESNDRVIVDGSNRSAEEMRDLYDDLDAADVIEAYNEVRAEIDDDKTLEALFQEEIASKGYSSDDMMYALSLLQNGKFAMPLCSLTVSKQVQELIFSIMNKRITRPMVKGAHMAIQSPVGICNDSVPFSAEYSQNLGLRFEGSGETRRMVGAETIMPFYDSRLKRWADKNGVLTRERIQELIDDGTFPEDLFKGYFLRTPSDEVHSITPMIIVGMSSNIGGSGMITAKEVDVFNGGDHDGDEVHVYFKDFDIDWNDDKIARLYRKHHEYSVRKSESYMEEDEFISKFKKDKQFRRDLHARRSDYEKVTIPRYDYSKAPIYKDEGGNTVYQNRRARNNAKVDIIYGQITSVKGSQRAVMPNSNARTDIQAKAIATAKAICRRPELLQRVLDVAKAEKIKISNPDNIYKSIMSLSSVKDANKLFEATQDGVSPYSFAYSVDSYRRVMGGASMIDVYALYCSAFQMLQRTGLSFNIPTKKSGELVPSKFFDTVVGKLFNVRATDGSLASDTLSSLLQSAVDNNKNPLLGYLNQTQELAGFTFFLAAAGLNQEQIHLIMTQPIMEQLAERLKARDSKGFTREAKALIRKLNGNVMGATGAAEKYKALDRFAAYTEDDFVSTVSGNFQDVLDGKIGKQMQTDLLFALLHIQPAVSVLTETVRRTRPEASSASIGPNVPRTVAKKSGLDDLRRQMDSDTCPINGLKPLLERVSPQASDYDEFDASKGPLHRVRIQNALTYDSVLGLLRRHFPQARSSWANLATSIAKRYGYRSVQEGTIKQIFDDMFTFKLLKNPEFVQDIEARREELLYDLPEKVQNLQKEILKAKRAIASGGIPTNTVAASLRDNDFIRLLGTRKIKGTDRKRILFHPGGPVAGNLTGKVMNGWADLLTSESEEVRQIGIDLFMYNILTNGYRFGMYEFGHLAPLLVQMQVPGLSSAMQSVLESDFEKGSQDALYFTEQYYMNHWNDRKLVPFVDCKELPNGIRELFGLSPILDDRKQKSISHKELRKRPFILVKTPDLEMLANGQKRYITKLYRLVYDENNIPHLYERAKLGYKGEKGQVTVYYNPDVAPELMRPMPSKREGSNASEEATRGENTGRYTLDLRVRAGLSGSKSTPSDADNNNSGPNLRARAGLMSESRPQVEPDEAPVSDNAAGGPNLMMRAGLAKKMPKAIDNAVASNDETLSNIKEEPTGDLGGFVSTSTYGPAIDDEEYDSIYDEMRQGYEQESETIDDVDEEMASEQDYEPTDDAEPAGINGEIDDVADYDPMADVEWDPWAGMTPTQEEAEAYAREQERKNMPSLQIVEREGGEVVTKNVPITPGNVLRARRMKVQSALNARLRQILADKGVGVDVLYDFEARLGLNGVTDFETARVTAEGLKALIRLREGQKGEEALPEEFSHLALAMLGTGHPLVARLMQQLETSEAALREAFGDQYDQYLEYYKGDMDMMRFEAAGKLVAKQLLREQEVRTSGIRGLIHRIVDAIKDFLGKFSTRQIDDAILDAEGVASSIARDLLSGKLADEMKQENIVMTGRMFSKEKEDITEKEDLLSELLKNELKRIQILKRRLAYKSSKTSSASISATEKQIIQLEAAIKSHKTGVAILDYVSNAMDFLKSAEEALDADLATGKPANSICKRIQVIRDTIYSYGKATKMISDAIASGEIEDTANTQAAIDNANSRLEKLLGRINRVGLNYFQATMRGFYGDDGVVIEVGRQKGRKVSIEDMTTTVDRDINLFSRWVNSMADSGELVLKAIDGMVRRAKQRARTNTEEIQREIVLAFDKLVQQTGSNDQSFMFAYESKDGKRVRNGKYISKEEAQKRHENGMLSDAQFEFYNKMMDLKRRIDMMLPDSVVEENKIVMLRKTALDKAREAEGIAAKGKYIWESIRNRVMDTSDSVDYDTYEVEVDFEGNRVDKLPVLYTKKSKKETYDDMTDDVATSILAYAGMANEYYQLNAILGEIENAKYMASRRKVVQHAGSRKQVETIQNEDYIFKQDFTKPQYKTNLQLMLDDFIRMHVYGHLHRDEGNFGKTKLNKQKTVQTLNAITSASQLAINLPQRIANVSVGTANIFIHAAGKGSFSMKELLWASNMWMKHSLHRISDTGANETNDKLSLFRERLDVGQENGRQYKNAKFKRSRLAKIFNTNLLYSGLMIGEDYLASTTALAMAKHEKVKDDKGNVTNLWEAYEVQYADPINKKGAYLAIKHGYTKMDGSPITTEDEYKFSDKVARTNFDLQGIYNQDDKSAIQSTCIGSLLIMYRKWMAPALKRRYSKPQYDAMIDEWTEGYWRTIGRYGHDVISNIWSEGEGIIGSFTGNWSVLTDYEKSNIMKAIRETAVLIGAMLAIGLLDNLPPDDDDKKLLSWARQMTMYQLLRLRNELGSQSAAMPGLMVKENLKILESPFAAIEPIKDALQGLKLLWPGSYFTKYQSGRYAGHRKAYKYFWDLPIISMFKHIRRFKDPSSMIQFYKNNQ